MAIKPIKRNSPNLDFLAQLVKSATSSLFANLLLALLPIQTQTSPNTHRNSPFVLYFWRHAPSDLCCIIPPGGNIPTARRPTRTVTTATGSCLVRLAARPRRQAPYQ
ncbi:hypothetical protein DEO72_LG2g3611 [Vigna unguiculata]|uniref:Uncharacterized protein n=1 Tax=Vigna unguiculata TaxID=3917 RepID=A0A4D6L468_VIGUN|nr:hypothetical protein DEO72_LG2g3611 [Vigna unguiculata]